MKSVAGVLVIAFALCISGPTSAASGKRESAPKAAKSSASTKSKRVSVSYKKNGVKTISGAAAGTTATTTKPAA